MYMNLVIGGGGKKGYSVIGSLKYFEENGVEFEKIAGSSVGSIMATFIAIGCTSGEIIKYYDMIDLSIFKINYFSPKTYYNLLLNKGVNDPLKLENIIGDILKDKTGNGDITFKQVYVKYGKFLTITGTCLNKRETHYYHHETNPDMKIKKAIAISCCVPLLFKPVLWKGDVLCDGGVLENYPLYFFNENCPVNSKLYKIIDGDEKINYKTIGIKYIDDETSEQKLYTGNYEIKNIWQYLSSILNTLFTGIERKGIKEKYWERTISINLGSFDSVTNLVLTDPQKEEFIKIGYNATANFFNI